MNKFDQVYQSIISEAKFEDKKWIEKETINDIQVFENYLHLKNRLKERYKINFEIWATWNFIKTQITNKFIELDLWAKCSKKDPYQRGFTLHLTFQICGYLESFKMIWRMAKNAFTSPHFYLKNQNSTNMILN